MLSSVGDNWTIMIVDGLGIDYALTALGPSLRGALVPLQQWAAAHRETIAWHRLQALTNHVKEG